MNHISHKIIKFCAEECTRQHSGEMSVARMIKAYDEAVNCHQSNTQEIQPWLIKHLALLIDPFANSNGYRSYPVTIDSIAVPFDTIEANIDKLCRLFQMHSSSISPDDKKVSAGEFYFYFERIHPFADGNGRVGAILYNWINGTLFAPIAAPDYFNAHH